MHALIRLLTIAAVLVLFSCQPKETRVENQPVQESIQTASGLPSLRGIKPDRSLVDFHQMEGNFMLVLFQPTCDHCQRQAADMREHIDEFKDYAIYFVTSDSIAEIEKFAADYGLKDKKQVQFVQTQVELIFSSFGAVATPSIYIYSKGKLRKQFNRETPATDIIASLEP
jgi:peroxiredoxin